MSAMQQLIEHLQQRTGQVLQSPCLNNVGGGDINQAYRLQASGVNWFVKVNQAELQEMFVAEAAGLEELAQTGAVRTPGVITCGSFQSQAYLVLEYIELQSLRGQGQAKFGQQLAQLHRIPQKSFGWQRDNTIGSTAQSNKLCNDWVVFWQEQRLGKQLEFAANNGYTGALQVKGEKLLERLAEFFGGHQPQASLLHGDLWGGNVAADEQGRPVMFDPACYYGDREVDIAMTELFGGFAKDFYAVYQAEFPLDSGYQIRKSLYNLYHILNHLNLFGRAYLGQACGMIESLLAELG